MATLITGKCVLLLVGNELGKVIRGIPDLII
jgi:hypothetical protein